MDVNTISAVVTVAALGLYVLLDGFDLGVGTLMATTNDRALRDRLAESIEPTWDGNETWLIFAGVALLAAFPVAYGILLPALYLPLILMLLSLGFRAVAFDFRQASGPMQGFWDRAFAAGSIGAAFAQGLSLGTLVMGIQVEGEKFAGSVYTVLAPYPVLVGVTLIAAYGVLGAAWARWRLPLNDRPFLDSRLRTVIVVFALLGAASVGCAAWFQPLLAAKAIERGLALTLSAVVMLLSLTCVWRGANGPRDVSIFLWSLLAAAGGLAGVVVALAPDIVPLRMTYAAASAPATSQRFFLIGTALVAPVIFVYTGFAYWVFRARLRAEPA